VKTQQNQKDNMTTQTQPRKTAEQRLCRTRRYCSTSICASAVRMLTVQVAVEDAGKSTHQIFPVVALRCTVVRIYFKSYYTDPPSDAGTEAQLINNGWTLDGEDLENVALVVSDDPIHGLVAVDRDFDCTNTATELVCCTWSPSEDTERLKPVIARLHDKINARRNDKAPRRQY
jgi:hypothetical protein